MEISRVGVIGSGTMGHGIAQVSAMSGFETVMLDVKKEFLDGGMKRISSSLDKMVERGKIPKGAKDDALMKIRTTLDYKDLAYCDIIIEAALERLDVKGPIFRELDSICKGGAILATNTSSISIDEIARFTKRPEKVVGMHFFNPVQVMKLVEVVRGGKTSGDVAETVKELSEKMGKTPVMVNDAPGFVSNRVLMPMINEAIFTLHEGVSTREGIDAVMKLGANHPMGPLELADLVGLDVCLDIMNVLHGAFKGDKYRPCPLLAKMVKDGKLGRKTGEGFYRYG